MFPFDAVIMVSHKGDSIARSASWKSLSTTSKKLCILSFTLYYIHILSNYILWLSTTRKIRFTNSSLDSETNKKLCRLNRIMNL